jgi:hypothetical protein
MAPLGGGGGGGITVNVGQQTISHWMFPSAQFTTIGANVNSSLMLQYVNVPAPVSAKSAAVMMSVSPTTSASASVANCSVSMLVGAYTQNISSLSLASSASTMISTSWNSNTTGSVVGIREFRCPMNLNMTPGDYWFGLIFQTATNYTGCAFSVMGQSLATLQGEPWGSSITNTRSPFYGQGYYSAATGSLPATIALSEITQTGAGAQSCGYWMNLINQTAY